MLTRNKTRFGFIAIVILIWYIFALKVLTSKYVGLSLPNTLQDLITLSNSVLIESLPFVILGIILSVTVQIWIPSSTLFNLLPKWAPLRRAIISLMGVFMPVCECGNMPLARGLILKGFTVSESLVFLLAAPILNPVTIITTHQAFREDNIVLFARIAGGFLIANIVGWIFSKHNNPESLLTENFAKLCKEQKPHSHKNKVHESIELFIREANIILPALFIGALIAGIVQVGIPREFLLTLGNHPVISVAVMMCLAVIISICSNVDAFFALAFSNSFTVGSLVSFLIIGPIVDIKMLSLMRTTYKTALLVRLTIITALISALIGLGVNYAF